MRWSLHAGSGGRQALRLAGPLAGFWIGHGHLREGRHWLTEVLATGAGTGVERARALDGAGLLAEGQGDYEEATRLLEESLALWRKRAIRPGGARARRPGLVAERQGDHARARAQVEEALALFRELGARTRWQARSMRSGSSPSSRAIPGRPGASRREPEPVPRFGRRLGGRKHTGPSGDRGQEEW